jgi:hypothetical protein
VDAAASAMPVAPYGQEDESWGTTAHLLGLLKYLVQLRTGSRLPGVSSELVQTAAEDTLGILAVSLLHVSLGVVNKTLLHDVVADVHDAITYTSEKAIWLKSAQWLLIAEWAKYVLPLPEPEIEIETAPVDDSHLAFRKYV